MTAIGYREKVLLWSGVVLALLLQLLASSAEAAPVNKCPDAIRRADGFSLISTPSFSSTLPGAWDPPHAYRYAVDPIDTDRLFVANDSAVMRSDDGGCTWKEAFRIPLLPNGAPTLPCDGAAEWAANFTSVPGCARISDIDVGTTETTHDRVYVQVSSHVATTSVSPPWARVGWTTYIYRSDDAGKTFSLSLDTSTDGLSSLAGYGPLAIAPSDPDTIYLARRDYSGPHWLFLSRDGGKTWAKKQPPNPTLTGDSLNALVVNPVDPDDVWVAGRELPDLEVYLSHSTDAGESWSRVPWPAWGFRSIDVAPTSRGISLAAAGARDPIMYLSTDLGKSWSEVAMPRGSDVVFGTKGRFVFGVGGEAWVARYDLKRRLGTTLKEHSWSEGAQADSQKMPTYSKAIYMPRGGLYFLGGCAHLGGPFWDSSCMYLARYTGVGT